MKNNDDMTCHHCNIGLVEHVKEYFPWTQEHWACPKCFSTYAISLYPMNEEISTKTEFLTEDDNKNSVTS